MYFQVIHGDLACRNVMLTENGIVKIGDFGLSRQLLRENGYKYNSTQQMIPIRWMAPESLESLEYSTQSDVWTFGITMWEMFSFVAVPYSDHALLDRSSLLQLLKESCYRLPAPDKSTPEV